MYFKFDFQYSPPIHPLSLHNIEKCQKTPVTQHKAHHTHTHTSMNMILFINKIDFIQGIPMEEMVSDLENLS